VSDTFTRRETFLNWGVPISVKPKSPKWSTRCGVAGLRRAKVQRFEAALLSTWVLDTPSPETPAQPRSTLRWLPPTSDQRRGAGTDFHLLRVGQRRDSRRRSPGAGRRRGRHLERRSARSGAKDHARTKAIIAVDYGGQPCDLDRLVDLATRNGLRLIEDAAHAIGARYRNRMVG